MPRTDPRSAKDRVAALAVEGRDCQGRAILAPYVENPFCTNAAHNDITYFDVDEGGNRLGDQKEARVCGPHLRKIIRSDKFEVTKVVSDS
jgi:hypothetical protein